MNNTYKGFSSKNFHRNKSFRTTDIETVNDDLMNHIFSRIGSRVKMAAWGTRIPDLPFEQLDDATIQIVKEDLETVFRYDPRVELVALSVIPVYNEQTILAVATLNYLELNMMDKLDVTIDLRA